MDGLYPDKRTRSERIERVTTELNILRSNKAELERQINLKQFELNLLGGFDMLERAEKGEQSLVSQSEENPNP